MMKSGQRPSLPRQKQWSPWDEKPQPAERNSCNARPRPPANLLWTEWTNTWLTDSAVAIAHLAEYPLQTKPSGFYFQLENHVQSGSKSKTLLKQPQCKTDTSTSTRADMEKVRSLSSRPYTPLWRYYTRPPYVPCLYRRAQSGRSSFGKRVCFIESHIRGLEL